MNWIKGIVRFWKTIQIVLIYILSIVLVYFMFPREGKFRYEYTKNKPWMHENLVAPFDFPIYKADEVVQRELDSLQANSYLYFFEDTLVGQSMIGAFNRDYESIAANMGLEGERSDRWAMTAKLIDSVLKETYVLGIVEPHPILEGKAPEETSVMVVRRMAWLRSSALRFVYRTIRL